MSVLRLMEDYVKVSAFRELVGIAANTAYLLASNVYALEDALSH